MEIKLKFEYKNLKEEDLEILLQELQESALSRCGMVYSITKIKDTFTGTVKSCWLSDFLGIECLEDDEQYGFFKDDNDVRPSSCTWIKKEKAEHLHNIFKDAIINKLNSEKADE